MADNFRIKGTSLTLKDGTEITAPSNIYRSPFGGIRSEANGRAIAELNATLGTELQGGPIYLSPDGLLTNTPNGAPIARVSGGGNYITWPANSLVCFGQSGQSNSLGTSTTPTINTGPLADAYQFIGVPCRPPQDAFLPTVTDSLSGLTNGGREVHGWTAVKTLIAEIGNTDPWLYWPHGIGSRTIAELSKGSVAYTNGLQEIANLNARAAELGKTAFVPLLGWIQGENDASEGTPPATYKAQFNQLTADYTADIGAETGQSKVDFLLQGTGGQNNHEIAIAQLELSRENANVHFANPRWPYIFLFPDDIVHLTNEGNIVVGVDFGLASLEVIRNGKTRALQPLSYQAIGTTIEITMDVYTLPMVIDERFGVIPGKGISYTKSNTQEIVPSISVSGNKLILDIGEPPEYDAVIEFGKDQSLGYSMIALRDSSTYPTGIPSYPEALNWCVEDRHILTEGEGGVEPVDNIWIYDDPITATVEDTGRLPGAGSFTGIFDVGQTYEVTLSWTNANGGSFKYNMGNAGVTVPTAGVPDGFITFQITPTASGRHDIVNTGNLFAGTIFDIVTVAVA